MPKYLVTIPIAGAVYVEVEAENKEQAEEVAFEDTDFSDPNLELEWEVFSKIAEGNVLHVPFNEVEVSEIKEKKNV